MMSERFPSPGPVQQNGLHPTLRELPRDGCAHHATAQHADLRVGAAALEGFL